MRCSKEAKARSPEDRIASSLRVVVTSCFAAGMCMAVLRVPAAQSTVALTRGMVITQSTIIRPGTYRFSASQDLATPAITIRGENITVDFSGAILNGSSDTADPDTFAGVGILVDGGSRVTVKNAKVRGYKVGIRARHSPDLHLTGNDVSYNWKQRLHSGIEKESLVDWMSYHQNEKDEWLRYGAGIYLRKCDRAEVDHNTAVQGQNGLMVTDSSKLRIWNNTFQFLSSLGVGLYRVSHSTLMHNRIDWCVRGYSHGFYNRGQDSAGLLMYEQSSNNVVAYNSVTHGGDGLFLWAGQSTMDTGQGGSNDNLFYGNDFSHAPTNGIEATFSRNQFIDNRVEENWHGVWGGYSFESVWHGNQFVRNTEGMAIEHGQDNRILGNTFDQNETAIRLWQNARQDPNWGYPKNRDTRSRDYKIWGNAFTGNKTDVDIKSTLNVDQSSAPLSVPVAAAPARLPGGIDPMIKDGERRGRSTIIVDEWGPYDWKSPKLWPVLKPFDRKGRGYQPLQVLGPPGTWKVLSARGVSVTPRTGKTGDVLTLGRPTPDRTAADYDLVLEYRGAAVTSPRGETTKPGAPYVFRYAHFAAAMQWTVNFFAYTDATDPIKQPDAFAKLVQGPGIGTLQTDRLDFLSGGVIEEGVPRDRFAFVAAGSVELPRGDYSLEVIADDGARVFVDGKLLLDAWAPHESRVDRAALTGGRHTLRVEYYEVAGWSEMRLDIQPRRIRP
jgi:nitrous oxidase accessory protein NosD